MRVAARWKRYVHAANLARDVRNWVEARANYEAALAENSALDAIWVQLGHACKEMGDLPAAEVAYQRALSLRPKISDTYLQLGHLFKVMGRIDEAARAYAEASQLEPGKGDAVDELARLGFTPTGSRVFAARFSTPLALHIGQCSMWFTLHATLEGIAASEVLRLHAMCGLQLGCTLQNGVSTASVTRTATAKMEVIDESTIQCRFVMPHDNTTKSSHLARIGFSYGEAGSFAASHYEDTWMVIDMREGELGRHYLKLTISG